MEGRIQKEIHNGECEKFSLINGLKEKKEYEKN
jgi:hypothetical protein